jgi:hypothetical protein
MPNRTQVFGGIMLAMSGYLPVRGQTHLGTIYHADNHNGAVLVFAENHGFVPYTIMLRANLKRMHCPDTLPARFVVFPSKQPQVLTTFTYNPADAYEYGYSTDTQFGIYTGHAPDSSYVYALPFQQGIRPEYKFFDERNKRKMHHHYFFNLPENTAVRAVREGIVANLRQDIEHPKGDNSNFIIVFHEDGTYAEYQDFNRNSVPFQIGQRVGKGEVICYASGLKKHWLRLCVQYPGASGAKELPVVFESGK